MDPVAGRTDVVPQPCVAIGAVCAHGEGVALIGATPDASPAVWVWRPGAGAAPVRRPTATAGAGFGPDDIARGEPFSLRGRSGRPVYGTLYRPTLGGSFARARVRQR